MRRWLPLLLQRLLPQLRRADAPMEEPPYCEQIRSSDLILCLRLTLLSHFAAVRVCLRALSVYGRPCADLHDCLSSRTVCHPFVMII